MNRPLVSESTTRTTKIEYLVARLGRPVLAGSDTGRSNPSPLAGSTGTVHQSPGIAVQPRATAAVLP